MRIGPLFVLGLLIAPLAISDSQPVDAAPEGQITWASQVTVVPGWFDPGEASVGSASMVLYALHDALVKPMPRALMAPSLAESWSISSQRLFPALVLRKRPSLHNA